LAELKFLGYLAEIAGAREKILVLNKPMLLRKVLPSPFPEKTNPSNERCSKEEYS
jgi:hypothetical protein